MVISSELCIHIIKLMVDTFTDDSEFIGSLYTHVIIVENLVQFHFFFEYMRASYFLFTAPYFLCSLFSLLLLRSQSNRESEAEKVESNWKF